MVAAEMGSLTFGWERDKGGESGVGEETSDLWFDDSEKIQVMQKRCGRLVN